MPQQDPQPGIGLLMELIEAKESRILLDAKDFFAGEPERLSHAAFELTSGVYQTHFITLWQLFDEGERFERSMDLLADKAKEIRKEKPFSSIITCTPTAKHIMEHVHSKIETEHERLDAYYLGPYPFLSPDNLDVLNFRRERVLILADVVSSGALVANLAEVVDQVGGIPVAVLTVVLTGKDLIRDRRISFGGRKLSRLIRLYSLVDREIPRLKRGEVDQEFILKINPLTVLPEEKLVKPNGAHPKFDQKTMFEILESAEAIDFQFYGAGQRRVTSAIRLDNLLQWHGDKLWDALSPHLDIGSQETVLATTFDYADVRFKEFIESRSPSKRTYVFIPSKDLHDEAAEFFLLEDGREKVAKKPVIILLASVYTAERLRSLSSLLASHSVTRITVICLFNRMGAQTNNFIARIRQLLAGVGNDSESGTKFYFHFAFELSDFTSAEIGRMQQAVMTLADYYIGETRVPSFRRWMAQEKKYFRTRSLTSRSFALGKSQLSGHRLAGLEGDLSLRSVEAQLSYLCGEVVKHRDYSRLITVLSAMDDKHALYKIFGIMIGDLSYLKMIGQFDMLRKSIVATLRRLRARRFKVESQGVVDGIGDLVQRESHLLFGLALFSYLDREHEDYDALIEESLTCHRSLGNWRSSPVNVVSYFGEDRIVWAISMLMHFSHTGFRQPEVAKELKTRLANLLKMYSRSFDRDIEYDTVELKHAQHQVKINLNLLLAELGHYRHSEHHEVIRFLQREIVTLPRRHSPLHSSLESACQALQAEFDVSAATDAPRRLDLHRRIQISDSKTKSRLDDGFYAAGVLEDIAEAMRNLFVFAKVRRSEVKRFTAEPSESGFAADVIELGDIFQLIRSDNSVSQTDLERLTQLRNRIFEDLWEPSSIFRRTLLRYIVDLRQAVIESFNWADERLASEFGLIDVWRDAIVNFGDSYRAEDLRVLIDSELLTEVLRNVALNVRYNLVGSSSPVGQGECVRLTVTEEAVSYQDVESEKKKAYELEVVSFGNPILSFKERGTFARHQSEVARYGGMLRLEASDSRPGAKVTLRLLARQFSPLEY